MKYSVRCQLNPQSHVYGVSSPQCHHAPQLLLSQYNADFSDYAPPSVEEIHPDRFDRNKYPRMPWHDVHCLIRGPAVIDIARHFVQRWNFTRTAKSKSKVPVLLPYGPLTDDASKQQIAHTGHALGGPNYRPGQHPGGWQGSRAGDAFASGVVAPGFVSAGGRGLPSMFGPRSDGVDRHRGQPGLQLHAQQDSSVQTSFEATGVSPRVPKETRRAFKAVTAGATGSGGMGAAAEAGSVAHVQREYAAPSSDHVHHRHHQPPSSASPPSSPPAPPMPPRPAPSPTAREAARHIESSGQHRGHSMADVVAMTAVERGRRMGHNEARSSTEGLGSYDSSRNTVQPAATTVIAPPSMSTSTTPVSSPPPPHQQQQAAADSSTPTHRGDRQQQSQQQALPPLSRFKWRKTPLATAEWYCSCDWTQHWNNVNIQLLRSVGDWSAGTDTESSIYHGYVHSILNAQHFIYIENQYFLSSLGWNKSELTEFEIAAGFAAQGRSGTDASGAGAAAAAGREGKQVAAALSVKEGGAGASTDGTAAGGGNEQKKAGWFFGYQPPGEDGTPAAAPVGGVAGGEAPRAAQGLDQQQFPAASTAASGGGSRAASAPPTGGRAGSDLVSRQSQERPLEPDIAASTTAPPSPPEKSLDDIRWMPREVPDVYVHRPEPGTAAERHVSQFQGSQEGLAQMHGRDDAHDTINVSTVGAGSVSTLGRGRWKQAAHKVKLSGIFGGLEAGGTSSNAAACSGGDGGYAGSTESGAKAAVADLNRKPSLGGSATAPLAAEMLHSTPLTSRGGANGTEQPPAPTSSTAAGAAAGGGAGDGIRKRVSLRDVVKSMMGAKDKQQPQQQQPQSTGQRTTPRGGNAFMWPGSAAGGGGRSKAASSASGQPLPSTDFGGNHGVRLSAEQYLDSHKPARRPGEAPNLTPRPYASPARFGTSTTGAHGVGAAAAARTPFFGRPGPPSAPRQPAAPASTASPMPPHARTIGYGAAARQSDALQGQTGSSTGIPGAGTGMHRTPKPHQEHAPGLLPRHPHAQAPGRMAGALQYSKQWAAGQGVAAGRPTSDDVTKQQPSQQQQSGTAAQPHQQHVLSSKPEYGEQHAAAVEKIRNAWLAAKVHTGYSADSRGIVHRGTKKEMEEAGYLPVPAGDRPHPITSTIDESARRGAGTGQTSATGQALPEPITPGGRRSASVPPPSTAASRARLNNGRDMSIRVPPVKPSPSAAVGVAGLSGTDAWSASSTQQPAGGAGGADSRPDATTTQDPRDRIAAPARGAFGPLKPVVGEGVEGERALDYAVRRGVDGYVVGVTRIGFRGTIVVSSRSFTYPKSRAHVRAGMTDTPGGGARERWKAAMAGGHVLLLCSGYRIFDACWSLVVEQELAQCWPSLS